MENRPTAFIISFYLCVCESGREGERRERKLPCHSMFLEDRIISYLVLGGRTSCFCCTVYSSLAGPWISAKSLVFDSHFKVEGIIGVCHCIHFFLKGVLSSEDLIEIVGLVLPAKSSPCSWTHSFSWWFITHLLFIYLGSFTVYPRWC